MNSTLLQKRKFADMSMSCNGVKLEFKPPTNDAAKYLSIRVYL